MRFLDGTANMYLALATILGAGLGGLRRKLELKMKDCTKNPTKFTDEEKAELGITDRMPRSLDESLAALEKADELAELVGRELISNWIEVKKAEQGMLNAMSETERRVWLMERY